jgi:Zn-finger nucleic acid-binding protein
MKCPTDDALLVMSDRSGIEIDYCPQCRGVWLDRGELDKIIERASAAPAAAPRVELPPQASAAGGQSGQFAAGSAAGGYAAGGYAQPQRGQRWGSNSPSSAPRYGGYGHPGSGQKRPRNWLSELFD